MYFFFSSRRRHTRFKCDWSSDVCSSDLSDTAITVFMPRKVLAVGGAPRTRLDFASAWPNPARGSMSFAFAGEEIGRASCREKCRCGGWPDASERDSRREDTYDVGANTKT